MRVKVVFAVATIYTRTKTDTLSKVEPVCPRESLGTTWDIDEVPSCHDSGTVDGLGECGRSARVT